MVAEPEPALRRADEADGHFIHMLAHELQNPVSAMTMMLSVMQKAAGLEEPYREYVVRSLETCTRMRKLIRDAVQFADAGTGRRPFSEVDCADVLKAAVERLGEEVSRTGAQIGTGEMPRVHGDRVELQVLFLHLIDNGIRYSGLAQPHVEIGCRREGVTWRISVADQGIGIDPEEHRRVFEPLHRLHSYDDIPGSGLGLAVCRKIVEAHGGRIGLDSEPRNGTTVWFTLPAESPPGSME